MSYRPSPAQTKDELLLTNALNSGSISLDLQNTKTIPAVKTNDMKSALQQRFNDLPPAPWPQLDLRIPQAILEGEMVGFDTSLPPPKDRYSNTIVTAYYEFTSKHSVGQYETWFHRILRASEPMIIFVEPGSKWFDFVKKERTHAPTILAQIPFVELVTSTTFTEEFWEFMHSIDTEAKVHKGSGVYKIWNEKLVSLDYGMIHDRNFEFD